MELAVAAGGELGSWVISSRRRAEPGVFLEQAVDDEPAGRAVEIAGRLVGEQQRGLGNQGARDRHALLLAARKLPGIMAEAMAEPDPRERRPAAASKASRRPASSSGIATFSSAVIVGNR